MSQSAPTAADRLLASVSTAAYRNDPYPFLSELRRQAPVSRSTSGLWVLTRYADVDAVVRDQALGHAPAGTISDQMAGGDGSSGVPPAAFQPVTLLDGPAHARVREFLTVAFPPAAIDELRPRVEALADRLAGALAQAGSGDLVTQYALPLALKPACELAGVPAADEASVVRWSAALATFGDPPFLLDDATRGAAARAEREFGAYVAGMVVQRRRSGTDDVISRLIASRRDGDRLEFAELVANGVFFIANAFHNTVNLIANALQVLLAYPRQLELLANERARIPDAIRELARFDSPVQVIGRYTRAEYEVGGVHIPPGEAIAAHVGAAHRDPEAYAEPELLDLRRERARPILTFGHGSHACLGAQLALMEAEVGLRALLVHLPRLELSEEPERTRGFALRGLKRLSVRSR